MSTYTFQKKGSRRTDKKALGRCIAQSTMIIYFHIITKQCLQNSASCFNEFQHRFSKGTIEIKIYKEI